MAMMEGSKKLKLFRLRGSEGPLFQVDETAVVEFRQNKVKLVDGQVFEVVETVDRPARPIHDGDKIDKIKIKSSDDVVFKVNGDPVPDGHKITDKIKIKSSDGVGFKVHREVARRSPTIMTLIQANPTGRTPVLKVKSKILEKVLDYCYKHTAPDKASSYKHGTPAKVSDEELKNWDADFVKVDMDTLYHLTMAARYLDIKGLRDLTCGAVADIIKGKTPEEIRNTFNIKNDLTPDEEEVAVEQPPHAQQGAISALMNEEL